MSNKWAYIAYGMVWVASALVIGFVVWVTKNGNWLWFLFVPGCISLTSKSK